MRFMMMIKSDEQSEAGAMPSEQLVEAMLKYNDELVKAGALLAAEGLRPSSDGAIIKFHGGKPVVTDGPFAEAKEVVAGYWLIRANSKEEAIEWAKRVPFEAAESSTPSGGVGEIEVRQVFEVEDFPVNENESGWREKEIAARAEYEATSTADAANARTGQGLGKRQFVIFRMADKDTEAGVMPSEELLAAMGAYNEEMMKAGVMITGEGLQPSSKGAKVTYSGGKRAVIDGPFTEAKELIAGFSVIRANSKEEALDWVKRWPAEDARGELELRLREVFMSEEFGAQLPPELREHEERQRAQMQGRQ